MSKAKILFLIAGIYLTFVSVVVKPWQFASHSLIDDPFVFVETSKYFNVCLVGEGCSQLFRQIFETGSGRLRPLYWIINLALDQVSSANPMVLHLARYYIVGLVAVLAAAQMCISAGGGVFSALLASMLLFISPTFTENMARLGTPDPYLVILFSLISWFVFRGMKFNKKYLLIFILSLTAALVKETAVVIFVPVLAAVLMTDRKNTLKWYLIQPFLIGLFYFVGRSIGSMFSPTTLSSFPNYISNYAFNPPQLVASFRANLNTILDLTPPIIKLDALFMVAIFALGKWKELLFKKHGLYWLVFAGTFFAVMIPWKFVIPRYHLVTIFGIYIFTGLLIEHALNSIKEKFKFHQSYLIFAVLYVLVGSNIFFRNFAIAYPQTINYINWYKIFLKFEHDQVFEVSQLENGKVYINASDNVNNLEVIYGMPIILKNIYGNPVEFSQLPSVLPGSGYLLERDALTAKIKTEDLKVVSAKNYTINQIDPIAFRSLFLFRPIQTLKNPPAGQRMEYSWQIKKFK